VIKSKAITWAEHVAFLGGIRNVYNILIGRPERKGWTGNVGVHGRRMLQCKLRNRL